MSIDGGIHYSSYSQAELNEALASIHGTAYPKNHRNLLAEISKRKRAPLVRQALQSKANSSMSTDGKVDYSKYGRVELAQALQSIDRTVYPGNYENLMSRLRELGPEPAGSDSLQEAPIGTTSDGS